MISIVMPTYNQGWYIAESVRSVLAQTYSDFELIVVNDASTDDTAQVLSAFFHPRMIVLTRTENGGTGLTLNTGFNAASPQSVYETWWASDNVMYPQNLAILTKYLDDHPEIDFVYGNCDIRQMDANGKEIGRKNLLAEVKTQTWDLDRFLQSYHLGICWLWRRALRERAGCWFQKTPCEDYDMTVRMAAVGGQFAHIPQTLGWFRRHNQNMSCRIRGKGIAPNYAQNLRKFQYIQEHGISAWMKETAQ